MLKELRVEWNFQYGKESTTYLADLNFEKYNKVKELIEKRNVEGKVEIEIKQTHEIGEVEKKILLKRLQRRTNYR